MNVKFAGVGSGLSNEMNMSGSPVAGTTTALTLATFLGTGTW